MTKLRLLFCAAVACSFLVASSASATVGPKLYYGLDNNLDNGGSLVGNGTQSGSGQAFVNDRNGNPNPPSQFLNHRYNPGNLFVRGNGLRIFVNTRRPSRLPTNIDNVGALVFHTQRLIDSCLDITRRRQYSITRK